MADQADEDLYIASFTLAEIGRGILEKSEGKKREQPENWFSGPEGPRMLFAGCVLPFDESAALAWARLMSEGTSRGGPRSALDMIIAAIAEVNDCVLVTDKEKTLCWFESAQSLPRLAPRTNSPFS